MSPPVTPPLLPLAMLITVGTMWGASFSISKFAALGGVPPVAYVVWQTGTAGLLLLALCRLRGEPLPTRPGHLAFYATTGIIGIAVPNANVVLAIEHLPAGLFAIIVTLVPPLTYLFALTLGMESLDRLRALGVLLGLAGALCIVVPEGSLPEPEMAGWVLLGLATPVLYACSNIVAARYRPAGTGALPLAAGMLLAAAAALAPVMVAFDWIYVPLPPRSTADWALIVQTFISALAYILLYRIIALAGPVFFGQVGFVVTAAGLFWGWLFFDDRHGPWIWLAVALVVAGVALVNWRRGAATDTVAGPAARRRARR